MGWLAASNLNERDVKKFFKALSFYDQRKMYLSIYLNTYVSIVSYEYLPIYSFIYICVMYTYKYLSILHDQNK